LSRGDGVNVLADWCQRGVRVIAITQQIDLSGPEGNLIASLLFGIAEIELRHAKERQAIGISLARKRGIYTGRSPARRTGRPIARPHTQEARVKHCRNRQGAGRLRASTLFRLSSKPW